MMCKAPVKLSPPTNQHPVFTGQMPSHHPTNSGRALKENDVAFEYVKLM